MSTKAENTDSLKNYALWIVVTALVGMAIFGNNYYAELGLLYRVLGIIAVGAVAVFVALQTDKGKDFSILVKESRVEIRKVVWPTKPETNQTTLVVVAFVFLLAIVLWLLDSSLSWAITKLIG